MFSCLLARAQAAAPSEGGWWPSQCLICRSWPARTLCAACLGRFAPATARCRCCALAVAPGVAVCGACLRAPPPMALCLAALPYDWPWTFCIGRWKFHGDVGLTRPLAQHMAASPGVADSLRRSALVLPMPVTPERLAERGHNPALLLARQLTRCAAVPAPHPELLLRTRHTPPQRTLPRSQRLQNVRGAFQVDPLRARQLAGRPVALVDDVMTTGASVREAAAALLSAGAASVTVLVLARTELPHAG